MEQNIPVKLIKNIKGKKQLPDSRSLKYLAWHDWITQKQHDVKQHETWDWHLVCHHHG